MAGQTLAQMIREKHPDAYADLSDQQLEQSVKAKFPGVYDDIPTSGPQMPARAIDPNMARPSSIHDQPATAPTAPQRQSESQLRGFAGEVGTAINPVEWAKGLYGMARDLVGTAQGIGAEHERVFREAQAAFDAGDYTTAGRKFVNYLVPIVGPAVIDKAADQFGRGEYGRGAGTMVGFGAQLAAPAALSRVPSVVARAIPRNPNPVTRGAVEFGIREGVPVDAATATGNRFVSGAQRLADESLAGSVVGGRARQAQGEALAATGERLANRANPAPVTAEQAGQGVRTAVEARGAAFNQVATQAYGELRALEGAQQGVINRAGGVRAPAGAAQPFTNVPLAVDVQAAKAALQPIHAEMLRESQIAPLQGARARALYALDRLMRAPDQAPLSIVDGALGDLKGLQRAAGNTPGASQIGEIVGQLDQQVTAAARAAGPDALRALQRGRGATVAKYQTLDLLDNLNTEPVRVFTQLTASRDAAVSLLRDVARTAPQELPRIGRAVIEGLIEKATREGGFGRAQGVFADWERLGTQTKIQLFQDPRLVADLNNFFLLAKRMADNPNPSGTALTMFKGAEAALLWSNPGAGVPLTISAAALSKLLHSPAAVRVMVRGLRIPAGHRAASATAAAELAQIARESGVSLTPALAEQSEAPQGLR